MRYFASLHKPALAAFVAVLALASVATAGSLTPPGVVSATMHSLANIWDTIASTSYDSSAISSNKNGSLIQQLKYIENNTTWASGSNNIWSLNSGNVGIGTTNLETKLEVAGTASISGLATFRGHISSPGGGANSEEFGVLASANGQYGLALGYNPFAETTNSIAIGRNTVAGISSGGIAIGYGAQASGSAGGPSIVIGQNAKSSAGYGALVIGTNARSDGSSNQGTAVGFGAALTNGGTLAIGTNAIADGGYSTAVGRNASASGQNTALGFNAAAYGGVQSVAVGFNARAWGGDATALGTAASASPEGIAIGFGAEARQQAIAFGRATTADNSALVMGYLSSTSGATIAFGSQVEATAGTFVAGSAGTPISNVYFGRGIKYGSPLAYTINGNGGEGTNIAGANLTLAGGISTGTANGGSLLFQTTPASGSSSNPNPLTTRMTINSLGKVGIGPIAPIVMLHISSNSATGTLLRLQDSNSTCDFSADAGAPTCGSDIRLKKDVTALVPALDRILALDPVTYHWKTESPSDPVHTGFIAQEVQSQFPDLVSSSTWVDGQPALFLSTNGLIPYLVKAMQELHTQVTSLSTDLFASIVQAFKDVLGITFSGGSIQTHHITADEQLCVGNVCITGDQLRDLMQHSHLAPGDTTTQTPPPPDTTASQSAETIAPTASGSQN